MLNEKYVNPWLKQETEEFEYNKHWVPGKYGVSVGPLTEDRYINPWLKQETWIVNVPEVVSIQEPFFWPPDSPTLSCVVTVTCP